MAAAEEFGANQLRLFSGHAHSAEVGLSETHDFLAAEREFERVIELNPRYLPAHQLFGWYLCVMDRYEEAYAEAGVSAAGLSEFGVAGVGFSLVLVGWFFLFLHFQITDRYYIYWGDGYRRG